MTDRTNTLEARGIDPYERADVATKRLLRALLETVEHNEPGVLAGLDPDFLHDYRVSVRRSRSLLTQVEGIFPSRDRKRFSKGLRQIQKATNRKRDLDVFALALPKYLAHVGPELAAAAAPLTALLSEEIAAAQQAMVVGLERPRVRRLLEGWRRFLESDPPAGSRLENAMRPVRDVASQRIWTIYCELLERGESIDIDSPPSEVHQLRLIGKKLRYLLESYASLFPARVRKEIAALKSLQDVLGDLNDYQVQGVYLEDFARRLAVEKRPGSPSQRAIEKLMVLIAKQQAGRRRQLEGRFARFATPGHRKAFARIFRADS